MQCTHTFLGFMLDEPDTILALVGAVLILPGLILNELLPMLGRQHPILNVFSIVAMVIAGYPIALSAWKSLIENHEFNINVLMTIASIGAIFIGAYTEAGLVMVLFAFGEALEGYTEERARDSIRRLMTVIPQNATLLRPSMDCQVHKSQDGYTGCSCPLCEPTAQTVGVEELQIGDKILVKPGERIPMDGLIITGVSSVNQAPITGESIPVFKDSGRRVLASSINGEGTLEIEVTHLSEDNTISRLIRMVGKAQENRAATQRFVDKFAKTYTPAVIGLALLVAAVPPFFFNAPFFNPASNIHGWLYRALGLLVIACPCALVISTPVSIISAITNAARNGVLIKGGAHLETLSKVAAIAFDKTGTLTKGKPTIIGVYAIDCAELEDDLCENCDDILAIASAVEKQSEHPLAQAVVEKSETRGVDGKYPVADAVTALPGKGVVGSVNGREVLIGSHPHFDASVPHGVEECQKIDTASHQGYTPMLISTDNDYVGFITIADTFREDSQKAIANLRQDGVDHLVMLTGDNEATAKNVATNVGITYVKANLLPEQKAEVVKDLLFQHGTVAMVGDGINDAPAMATASIGIAMGGATGGTDQVMETADVVLMSDDLNKLPYAYKLSKMAMRIVRENVFLSLGIKLLFLILVLIGTGSLWLAVFADVGGSVLVTLNGMRLLKFTR